MVMEGSGASPGHLVSLLYGLFALVWLLECWGACWSWPSSHFGRFVYRVDRYATRDIGWVRDVGWVRDDVCRFALDIG